MLLYKLFNKMIDKNITPRLELENYQFSREKHSFYYYSDGIWRIINFQKSAESNNKIFTFTVNTAIASRRILFFLGTMKKDEVPDIWDAQWNVRLGHLTDENADIWWTINNEMDISQLGQNILEKIKKYAIPSLERYHDDNSLRDLWISGKSPSLTNFQRLLYLAVLLKEIGPRELLEPTITKLRQATANKPSAITAEIYINKIEKGY